MMPVVALALVMRGRPLAAQSARQLKSTGFVGERLDGYLGIVSADAGADVRSAVDRANAERRQVYERTASKSGNTLADVQATAGARQRENAQPGDWVQNAAGEWMQKR